MATYCLEFGSAEEYYVTIHKLSCANIDHGSLLGMGRLSYLGNFDSSFAALSVAKSGHQSAVRCLDCCIPDLFPVSTPQQAMHIERF